MPGQRQFVLFELNEVPIRVVRHFADRHPHSAFARILRRGRTWDTLTPDTGHLSPWITWPTLHRGVAGKDHKLLALGQDHREADARFPPVWTFLASAGRRVGMFGSLHTYPLPEQLENFDFYVPDTFAAGPETKPASLTAFQSFNLQMVDRSGRNVSSSVPVRDALSFLLRAMPAGLRPATIAKVARQVAAERIWRHRTARRRTIQSLLAFDLFHAQLRARKPDAAFFFTNHVASSMHRYWPATFNQDYSVTKWSDDWLARFADEIDYTMSEADQMLGELLAFADRNPGYLVLVAGSMGQAAVDDPNRQVSTAVLLRDAQRLVERLGVEGPWQRQRTMEPTYTLAFEDEADAGRFAAAIARVRVDGEAVESRRLDNFSVEFKLGQTNIPDHRLTIMLGNEEMPPAAAGLENVPIDDEAGASAYHVREGMLLAYDPLLDGGGSGSPDAVSTTRIAPTLLALQGVSPPAYMDRPLDQLVEAKLQPA